MTIEYPRPLNLGPRIYGLGVRQLVYLSVGACLGGLFALGVFTPGVPFLARGLAGLLLMSVGVCLAFLRISGLYLDRLLAVGLRFLFQPRQLVWRKAGEQAVAVIGESLTIEPDAPPVSLALQRAESVPVGVVVFALNAVVVVILLASTWYMANGGLLDLHRWMARVRF
jgi:hypothetical protein